MRYRLSDSLFSFFRRVDQKIRRTLGGRPGRRILVIGDSHAAVFLRWKFITGLPHVVFQVISVGGATASGLDNPNSKTGAADRFKANLASFSGEEVIVMLGEVDCGFVIWWRHQKRAESVDDMFELTMKTYTGFLEWILSLGKRLIVIAPPLPTIRDNEMLGEVANARREVTVSQAERTRLTLRFAAALAEFCSAKDVPFVDLSRASLGADGLVAAKFYHSDPTNHHYNPRQLESLLLEKLRAIL